jgi:uncharacterized LabA/DUF88 family protein
MAQSPADTTSMALFCDFENVALGVRDAKYDKFDIKKVLERLLLKGSIVVKKAYCDWERYKGFKATMHEANFELIEIPHVRQSGKNSADIRLVVDALDLCYTKSHVNTFVIISGDSDFSPLVSKLRENAKQVIGVGVKQSTSDLLIANCDEFIFYDDLVRDSQRAAQARRAPHEAQPARRAPEEEHRRREDAERRRTQAIEMVLETFEALVSERGDSGKIRASVVKDALKRRRPDFSEGHFGFRTFGSLLEEAQSRGLLELGRDDKSNVYAFRSASVPRHETLPAPAPRPSGPRRLPPAEPAEQEGLAFDEAMAPAAPPFEHAPEPEPAVNVLPETESDVEAPPPAKRPARGGRGTRGGAARKSSRTPGAASGQGEASATPPAQEAPAQEAAAAQAPAPAEAPAPKPRAPRARRPRKSAATEG